MIKRLFIAFWMFVATSLSAQTRVFLIGDSTTEAWSGPSWYPCMGWGAVLQHFFDKDKVVVDNRAVGGTTTKSFYNEHWNTVIPDIQSGDYLFISFGANDSNTYATWCTTTDEFIDYIGIFCDAARAKGATPVLLSTVNRNSWGPHNLLNSSYGQHPQAMKEAAEKYDTPFFDLYTFGFNLSEEVGSETILITVIIIINQANMKTILKERKIMFIFRRQEPQTIQDILWRRLRNLRMFD